MPNTATADITVHTSNPATFSADPNPLANLVPLAPPQTAFRVAQHTLTRAAVLHESRIEVGFDTTTGRYHLSATECTTHF